MTPPDETGEPTGRSRRSTTSRTPRTARKKTSQPRGGKAAAPDDNRIVAATNDATDEALEAFDATPDRPATPMIDSPPPNPRAERPVADRSNVSAGGVRGAPSSDSAADRAAEQALSGEDDGLAADGTSHAGTDNSNLEAFAEREQAQRLRRHMRVAEAAYLRAARRGFEPGHELEDWLAAEAEVDAQDRSSSPLG